MRAETLNKFAISPSSPKTAPLTFRLDRIVFNLTGETVVPLECVHPDPVHVASTSTKNCSLQTPYLFDAGLDTYSFWWHGN